MATCVLVAVRRDRRATAGIRAVRFVRLPSEGRPRLKLPSSMQLTMLRIGLGSAVWTNKGVKYLFCYSRFSSSDFFRVILIAHEIETRYDFITSCMVVPNCSLPW